MWSRRLTICGAVVLVLATSAALAAGIAVKVNDHSVRCSVAPFARHDTKFVEIEPVCRACDATFQWDKDKGTVSVARHGRTTTFTVGEGPRDAYIRSNHATAGYRILAEKLGGSATYDEPSQAIAFTMP